MDCYDGLNNRFLTLLRNYLCWESQLDSNFGVDLERIFSGHKMSKIGSQRNLYSDLSIKKSENASDKTVNSPITIKWPKKWPESRRVAVKLVLQLGRQTIGFNVNRL